MYLMNYLFVFTLH